MSLDDYAAYLKDNFNPSEMANALLLETNTSADSNLDLETSLKRLEFDMKDLKSRVNATVRSGSTSIVAQMDNVSTFHSHLEVLKPSLTQLENSFARLDNEIIKPYNECTNLHSALKKIHSTNSLLRTLMFALHLLSQLEEIDKSDTSLASSPYKSLLSTARLITEFQTYTTIPSLNTIKLIRDYTQFTSTLAKRCIMVINNEVKNMLKFPTQEYASNNVSAIQSFPSLTSLEEAITNLITAANYLDPTSIKQIVSLMYNTATKHSTTIILRNFNNTKYLPAYIRSLQRPRLMLVALENALRNIPVSHSPSGDSTSLWEKLVISDDIEFITASISLTSSYWRTVAIGLDAGVKEVVARGGPILRNLQNIRKEMETEVQDVVVEDGVERRMVLNSLTNLEKRR